MLSKPIRGITAALTLLLGIAPATLFAQKPTTAAVVTSVPSLAITPDARGAALGHSGVASSADLFSQYWNPAKYLHTPGRKGFSLGYTPWLNKIADGIALMNVEGYYRFSTTTPQTLSASLHYFTMGKITQWDDRMNQVGQLGANEWALDLAYAQQLTDHYGMSVAARYIHADPGIRREGVGAGSAFAMDVTGFYTRPLNWFKQNWIWNAGFSIKNIGTKISFDGGTHSGFIPANLALGMALKWIAHEEHTLELNLEMNKLLVPTPPIYDATSSAERDKAFADYYKTAAIAGIFKSLADAPGGFKEEWQEIRWSTGLEYSYRNMFYGRAGWSYIHPNKGALLTASIGAGLRYNGLTFDAAYLFATTANNPVDGTMSFSLGVDLEQIHKFFQ